MGQTRSFRDVGPMSGFPGSGHGWAIYKYTQRQSRADRPGGCTAPLAAPETHPTSILHRVGPVPRIWARRPRLCDLRDALREAAAAHRAVEAREVAGAVVLVP